MTTTTSSQSATPDKTAPIAVAPAWLWLNGEVRAWDSATVHVSELMWTGISAVFEGIRGYWNEDHQRLYVFRLDAHIERLWTSMRLMRMTPEFTRQQVHDAVVELLARNGLGGDRYCTPFAFFGGGIAGYRPATHLAPDILITTREQASFLGTEAVSRCCVSTWQRISDNVMPPRAKCVANYQNSRLVATEAHLNGYDDGIILNPNGKVSEGGYACIVLIRDGVAITPPTSAGILESITRDSVLQLCAEQGIPVSEREVDRTELYVADEAFLCGTFAEIRPIVSVDQYTLGDGGIGPLTRKLQQRFEAVVRGHTEAWADWRTEIRPPA